MDAHVFAEHYLGAESVGGHWNISGTGIKDYVGIGYAWDGYQNPYRDAVCAYLKSVSIYLTTLTSTGVVYTGGPTGIRPDWITGCEIEAMLGDGGDTVGAAGSVRMLGCHVRANKALIDLHDGSAEGCYFESGGSYVLTHRPKGGTAGKWACGPGTYVAGPHPLDPNFGGQCFGVYFESCQGSLWQWCGKTTFEDCYFLGGGQDGRKTPLVCSRSMYNAEADVVLVLPDKLTAGQLLTVIDDGDGSYTLASVPASEDVGGVDAEVVLTNRESLTTMVFRNGRLVNQPVTVP